MKTSGKVLHWSHEQRRRGHPVPGTTPADGKKGLIGTPAVDVSDGLDQDLISCLISNLDAE
jgi:hypothetical protein